MLFNRTTSNHTISNYDTSDDIHIYLLCEGVSHQWTTSYDSNYKVIYRMNWY